MKKLLLILISLFVLSCSKNTAPKPEHLLEKEEMVNILYDIALLQSIKSFQPTVLDTNNVNAHTYIYKKYKIDSLTLVQNHTYYASDIEGYERIENEVSDRLKKNKEELTPKKDSTTVNKAATSAPVQP